MKPTIKLAERLELSPEMEEKIEEKLGNPKTWRQEKRNHLERNLPKRY